MKIKEKLGFVKRAIKNSIFADFYLERSKESIERRILSDLPCLLAKQRFETITMFDQRRGVSEDLFEGREVIVSLTTYSKRIQTVFYTIESLLQQTHKANRIILWLAEEEFSEESLPLFIQQQQQRGLEVRFTKDIRSFKKLVPTIAAYPEAIVITVDDDYIYPLTLVERLLRAHKQHPNSVCAICARTLQKKGPNTFGPYEKFPFEQHSKPMESLYFIPEGFGGILYPPHSLHPDVTREDLFMQLTPQADDIWFKAMGLMQGTPVLSLNREGESDMYIIEEGQEISLSRTNLFDEHRNDRQLKAVFDHYQLYDRLD